MSNIKQSSTLLVKMALILLGSVGSIAPAEAAVVSIAPAYQDDLQIKLVSGSIFDSKPSRITQMALGPDDRLYAVTLNQGVLSFAYDANTGALSDMKTAVDISGLGIGFQGNTMYLSSDGNIVRLTDNNRNGVWGEPRETRVNIVEGIPTGDHGVENIQIQGNTLYVGIGTRTINGQYTRLFDPKDSLGESSYGGSISWIQDLTKVPSRPNSAQLRDQNGKLLSNKDFITNGTPYTSKAPNKLIVNSSGARNPFGLAFDANGNLWMTNNYNRANSTNDGKSIPNPKDALDNNLNDDVYDQFFRVKYQADYGFANGNWRNNPVATKAGFFNANKLVRSTTFDNLEPLAPGFHKPYNPTKPNGLGPSSSADGFDFYKGTELGSEFFNKAFVTRWTHSVQTPDGKHTLNYADIVLVDPLTGQVSQVATGFNNPLDVLADEKGLFVADYDGGIYRISAATPAPESSSALGTLTVGFLGGGCILNRQLKKRR